MNIDETVWWFLGTDTDGMWHERSLRAPTKEVALSWWKERAGKAPDVAWSAREALLRFTEGRRQLALWPHLPDGPPPNWFLAWLGNAKEEMTLVAVPAADEEHAVLILASEQPDCNIRILGDLSALDAVQTRLSHLLENPASADEDLFPRPSVRISPELSEWINQQFDMEPSP